MIRLHGITTVVVARTRACHEGSSGRGHSTAATNLKVQNAVPVRAQIKSFGTIVEVG
jgi:hypothetical protein